MAGIHLLLLRVVLFVFAVHCTALHLRPNAWFLTDNKHHTPTFALLDVAFDAAVLQSLEEMRFHSSLLRLPNLCSIRAKGYAEERKIGRMGGREENDKALKNTKGKERTVTVVF